MTSPKAADKELDCALARSALEDLRESAQIYSAHHNTMVCLVYLLFERAGIPLPPKLWAFENATVVEFCGEIDGSCRITMIHPKKVSNPDRFTSPEVFNAAMQVSSHKHLNFPPGATAFVFRHGVCDHNDSKTTTEKARDCLLTELGMIQVRDASITIATSLKKLNDPALTTYCSDLRRSMQSLQILLSCLPQELQQSGIKMCLESRERTRAIGTDQHWRNDDSLRPLAIDPYRKKIEEYSLLFPPGTTHDAMERSLVENLPLSSIKGPVTDFEGLQIDSRDYVAKVQEAEASAETFGHAASRNQFLDVIIQNAQRAQQALQ